MHLEKAHDGGCCKYEAEKLRADITHEYLCGIHVVGHKSEAGTGETSYRTIPVSDWIENDDSIYISDKKD